MTLNQSRSFLPIFFILITTVFTDVYLHANENLNTTTIATFKFLDNENIKFESQDKKLIREKIKSTVSKVSKLIPELADSINFTLLITERDLSIVNGVSGRADKPTQIEIILSNSYKNGLNDAILDGLEFTLFHELHHTVRGWTIYGNKFPVGIDNAAVNEGLADVFASTYTNTRSNNYSKDENFDAWVKEILALPKNANYSEWMFSHPDGRKAIGYRAGSYIIE